MAAASRDIARPVGYKRYVQDAGLYPEDKLRKVKDLASCHGAVAMVGGRFNDAPPLAVVDVGIAMGGIGMDVALEIPDVVLSMDDVSMVPCSVALGRRPLRIIRQNLAIALTVIVAPCCPTFSGSSPCPGASSDTTDGSGRERATRPEGRRRRQARARPPRRRARTRGSCLMTPGGRGGRS
jgi:cation transport ATPase